MRSAGFRFFVVGVLTILMAIPLMMAGVVVLDRSNYADSARREVGQVWGGPQRLSGPVLEIPVEGIVLRTESRLRSADGGEAVAEPEVVTLRERGRVAPVVLLPETLDLSATTRTELRERGLFEVPVYVADVSLSAVFDTERAEGALAAGETLVWDEATVRLRLSDNRGLRGETRVEAGGRPVALEPLSGGDRDGGIEGAVGDPRDMGEVTARLTVNGAERLMAVPVGRTSRIEIDGDWPDPGFTGTFLPDTREVGPSGHSAFWTIPHLARPLPQVLRDDAALLRGPELGVQFVTPNDFYQKAWRAARYGILFIALTFLTVLLTERRGHPTHPVQYVLIGLAQAIFVLLMVAFAERIGFTAAYLVSSGATIVLLVVFGVVGLKLGRRVWVLGGALVTLYAVLYLILQSTDWALLAGAILAFLALAGAMILTRNETWYGPDGPGSGFRGRAPSALPDPAKAPPR